MCPLSAKQVSGAELDRILEPVWHGTQPPVDIRLTRAESDESDEDVERVAVGFEYTVQISGPDQSNQPRAWPERRLVVRSLALAERQEAGLRQRVAHAAASRNALDERKKGKKRLPDEQAVREAARTIMAHYRVAELVKVEVRTETHEQPKRRYGTRPATTVRTERVRVQAAPDETALEHVIRRLGWRVYATNHDLSALNLEQAVAAYRSEYLIEQGFGRLKGRTLSLAPLFLQYEHRSIGLIYLLTIALRVLVLVQFVVRGKLQDEGATLKGIYPGQPGRQTTRPTTEMMLRTFRGVTLSHVTLNEQSYEHLTPLSAVQQRILDLLGLPPEIFSRLVPQLSNTGFHSRET